MIDTADLIKTFKTMTLAELTDFTRQFEETFGVTATVAPVAVAAPAQQETGETEPDDVTLTLRAAGSSKIQVIKVVREVLKLGLKEAKDLVESAPVALLADVPAEQANAVAERLTKAGADVAVN